jgi:hypothetical protein
MGMPQKEAVENRNLWMKTGKGASHFCYRGVANLIQLTTGRVNAIWNVVGLVALTPCSEPTPTQADNQIAGTVQSITAPGRIE